MKLNIQLFGGSVAIQTITETTDIDTNQSTFTIPAKMTTTGETHNYSNASMTMQWKYASANSWTSLNKQTFSINKSSNVTKNWTLTLTHNDDGSLENVQFRVSWYITDSTKGTTGATTFTPTTIPRASQPSIITWPETTYDITMGEQIYIHMNRVSSSFTHSVYYNFGSLTNQLIATNVTDNCTWTPPLTMANQVPSATSGVGGVLVKTYNGSTYVGEKSVSFRANVPSSVVPSVSFTQVQEAGDVPSSWGIYVKNKSRIALALSGSGAYSSAISGYRISYYGGAVLTQSATTSYLTQAGSTTFTGQVTDTRGRSASTTTTINVVDYYNPTISTAQVQRCDENGNIDNNGEYMYISYGASISSCSNKNTPSAVYKVGYRVHNTGDYTYVNLTTNANSYSTNGMLFSDGIKASSSSGTKVQFSTNNTYDIQFYVRDYFMEYTNLQLLDAGFDLMNFNASGKAMAIGKVSEAGANEELLEVGMNTELVGDLKIIKNGEPRITMNTGTYEAITLLKSGTSTFIGGQGGSIYLRPTNVYNSSNEMRAGADGNFYIKNRTAATNGSILAYINTTQTLSNEYTYLNYNSSYNLSNGTLSVASPDGMIVVGSGVSKVRVSGAIFFENVGSWVGYVYCFLRKNGTNVSSTIMSGQAQYFNTLIISPRIIEVSQGDYIQLLVNNPNYSIGSFTARGGSDNTYLLVEAIE